MPQPPAPTPVVNAKQNSLPDLTVPQILAFVTFVVVVILALLKLEDVTNSEFHEVRKLAILLIAALLPSDALIRLGRTLFLKGRAAAAAAEVSGGANAEGGAATSEQFRPTTVAQILAFATFLIIAVLAVVNGSIESDKGKETIDVAVFLIGALLPSEAGIRFARALYFRDAPNITAAHLKKI